MVNPHIVKLCFPVAAPRWDPWEKYSLTEVKSLIAHLRDTVLQVKILPSTPVCSLSVYGATRRH